MRTLHFLIAAAVLVLDQITKAIITARFAPDTVIPVIPELFRLVLVENRGIAFGLFADSDSKWALALLLLFTGAALGFVGYLLWANPTLGRLPGTGLALVLGGAAGNFLDRLLRGSVVDFLDFYVGEHHWPAFNLADSAIVVGAGLLLLDLVAGHPKPAPDGVSSENR